MRGALRSQGVPKNAKVDSVIEAMVKKARTAGISIGRGDNPRNGRVR
jgi:hypothetical protein